MITGREAAASTEGVGSVTGVASGGLGTAANLEDTQLWDLDDLRRADESEAEPPSPPSLHPVPRRVVPVPAARPSVLAAPRGQRRTSLLAVGAVGILVLVGALALREGLPGTAITGQGNSAEAVPSAAPITTGAPAKTAAPKPVSGGSGSNGSAGGHGKGHGGDKNK